MTNAGLFNLPLSALGGGGAVLLLESWAMTAAALVALATGQISRLLSSLLRPALLTSIGVPGPGQISRLLSSLLLVPYGVLLTGLVLGAVVGRRRISGWMVLGGSGTWAYLCRRSRLRLSVGRGGLR